MDEALERRLVEAVERGVSALEAIAAALEEPGYMPMGMVVVEKNSPEHRRAVMQSRLGVATPLHQQQG